MPQHCNSGGSNFLCNVKCTHTSPSSGLSMLLLVRNQGALRRVAETSASSLQAAGCKLLSFPNWDAGSPAPPLFPEDRAIRVHTGKGIHASRGKAGVSEAPGWFRQAYLRKTALPRPWVASSFWLFGVKITVCNLDSS